jgi:beta-phosphoglucomutase-like phosphatase (HAD superfamily)
MAYYRACCSFLAWLDMNGVTKLADTEPIHIAAYVEAMQATSAGRRRHEWRRSTVPSPL